MIEGLHVPLNMRDNKRYSDVRPEKTRFWLEKEVGEFFSVGLIGFSRVLKGFDH